MNISGIKELISKTKDGRCRKKQKFHPKGFWRVDKKKPPELRHTTLSLAAFRDLKRTIEEYGGDRDEGIKQFCEQNDGEGWMLPERIKFSVNEDGTIDITDKGSGKKFRRCLQFVDEGDRGDSYNFDAVAGGEVVDAPSGAADVSVLENGPVSATLKVQISLRIPDKLAPERDARSADHVPTTITTLVSIYRDIKRIDFRTTLDNQCEDHRLRVLFNGPFTAPDVLVETAFGLVRRPSRVEPADDHFEKPIGTSPQKTFSCAQNDSIGVALFNRGIPEIEAAAHEHDMTLALTLVRSVGWLSREDLVSRPAAAGPELEAPGAQSKGPHTFEYAFTSYRSDHGDADIVGQAHSYAFPPIAIITGRHRGKIKDGSSLVEVDNPAVIASAVEPSRLKRAYLVRLYNATDRKQNARLALWGRNIKVYEVNALEKRLSKEPLRRTGGRLEFSFRPAEIKSLQAVIGK